MPFEGIDLFLSDNGELFLLLLPSFFYVTRAVVGLIGVFSFFSSDYPFMTPGFALRLIAGFFIVEAINPCRA